MLTRKDDSPTDMVPAHPAEGDEKETASAATSAGESSVHGEETTDENAPRAKTRAWLSFSTRTPSDNDDIDVLAPEVEESSS
ncbi:hypothetical protein GCK32_022168, partial [Trichostrongylus colubriformis]